MKPLEKETEEMFIPEFEDQDPVGPMMEWNGDRSEEDIQFMSNWVLARKAELEREKAQSATDTDQASEES